ncbi:NAD-dependent dihydropyrimidine dehydrogenase subunit PreA [Methanocalculus taiwanensis]|uniref:Dihydroorotate dehydrogenase B (NAD(+)), catalytic subunit n=2 Tax=Methanocalculus taiwanensis TaxID=106207 RepID=A0ABD4TI19_9EURY|nr:NAD-dependent dihydropyrimidine dehydrogenase subunit PreA [Methanocalculus taiwanensis]MCQ1537593.1 NAD-dependent dihydropyrimidine dehydrogenase subunit PreA [Methanocalculus taiwanensis]
MYDSPLLKTTLGSLTLENPFILSSGPPTSTGKMIRRGLKAGWGGAVIKTITPDDMPIRDVSPRFTTWKGECNELFGFENIELLSKHSLSYWIEEIRAIKSEYPDQILIASIMGSPDPATWQDLAEDVQNAGCDAIELNVSCPHGMPEAGVGSVIGQNPRMVQDLTQMVIKVADVPVYVKLTPNITDISPVALAAALGKADGISAINTVGCMFGLDIETFEPLPNVDGYSTYGGYSGPAIRPIGLKMVSQIAKTVPLPIMGIGGISRWQDAVEYLLLGASALQVCTAVMWNGYGIVRRMKKGLASYLERKEYSSPDELRGLSLERLTSHQSLDRKIRIHPVISNPGSCIRCGRCVVACRDGGYQALELKNDGITINTDFCDGCGLCIQICSTGTLKQKSYLVVSD